MNSTPKEGRLSRLLSGRRPSPAAVIACIALCFATVGGAYGAVHHKKGKSKFVTKAEAIKIAQREAGKNPGPPGPPGKDGSNGSNGQNGADGTPAKATPFVGNQHGCPEGGIEVTSAGEPVYVCNGKKGTDGTPVEAIEFEGVLGPCLEGGIEVTSATDPVYVCNGKEGKEGKEGSPWTLGGTLPPGATETGTWSFNASTNGKVTVKVAGVEKEITIGEVKNGAEETLINTTLSFPIPLAKSIEGANVQWVSGVTPAGCKKNEGQPNQVQGTVGNPQAAPGHICVWPAPAALKGAKFKLITSPAGTGETIATGLTGARLLFEATGEFARGWGTFAVTGCAEATVEEPNPPFKCP